MLLSNRKSDCVRKVLLAVALCSLTQAAWALEALVRMENVQFEVDGKRRAGEDVALRLRDGETANVLMRAPQNFAVNHARRCRIAMLEGLIGFDLDPFDGTTETVMAPRGRRDEQTQTIDTSGPCRIRARVSVIWLP